jgi:hypothetical protein
MKSKLFHSAIGFAMMFLLASLVIMLLGIMAGIANAGTVCRQQIVAHQYAAPLVAPVYYQIGQSLQREAIATQQLRQSDEYLELLELRGFKAGVDAVTASAVTTSGPPQPASHPGHPAATEEGQTAEPANGFAARYPTLAAKCQKCHSGDTPKGDVFLDGTVPLDGPDAATKRDAIARAIINERMPDGKPLEDQEQYNALVELFTESTPPEGE